MNKNLLVQVQMLVLALTFRMMADFKQQFQNQKEL